MANRRKKSGWLALLVLALGVVAGYFVFRIMYASALALPKEEVNFYIRSGWDSDEVFQDLEDRGWLRFPGFTRWMMERKNYAGNLVVSGKYTLRDGMNINELINHLRAGNGEEEVKITFGTARTLPSLAGDISRNIEADSASIAAALLNPETARKYGFNQENFVSMFLPDTYNAEWDTDANEFLQRMADEYKKFWTEERKRKARELGLSQSEVSTLASIVQAEQQSYPEERPAIAGLYLNRLKRGMRLQSDPTVIFATGDFSINRVLTRHLIIDSPYNTYLYSGLPPGPILIPSKRSIEAVLNADQNDFIYMCAKADFSGYHAFATTLAEHNKNARAFQQALNARKIYR